MQAKRGQSEWEWRMESESQAMQRQRVGLVTGLMPRAGNFRNICAAASDVICIRPRPVARPRPCPCYATSVNLGPGTCCAPPPPSTDMRLLAFACFFFNIFASAFAPHCFLPTFFQLLCQPSGSEFLCNLSACCTSCLTMLHLWFYYIAAKDLWPSRLFASCDRNLQPAAAVCRCCCRRDRFMGAKDKPQIAT